MKFGLSNIRALLKFSANPEWRFASIHIAGTNGKGSTASFIASVFMEGGYKTALYTSPHLVRFNERIRIDGKDIPDEALVEYTRHLRPMIDKVHATFFEATTCIAFQYFADNNVEIAVIEAGLGGRLDSTNVLKPLVSVITNISLEHTQYLGNTLTKIAHEKAGIIKRDVPCITASEDKAVIAVLRRVAKRKSARLIEAKKRINVSSKRGLVNFRAESLDLHRVKLGLPGNHQIINATTAVAAIDILLLNKNAALLFPEVDNVAVKRGLTNVRRNTNLRGRMEAPEANGRIIFDVAHNEAAFEILLREILPYGKNLIAVFGVMKDKNYLRMCELLGKQVSLTIAVQPKTGRALESVEIVRHIRESGGVARDGKSVRNGIRIAKQLAGSRSKILVTGSHYVVGEGMEALERM